MTIRREDVAIHVVGTRRSSHSLAGSSPPPSGRDAAPRSGTQPERPSYETLERQALMLGVFLHCIMEDTLSSDKVGLAMGRAEQTFRRAGISRGDIETFADGIGRLHKIYKAANPLGGMF